MLGFRCPGTRVCAPGQRTGATVGNSITLAEKTPAEDLELVPRGADPRARRRRPATMAENRERQCKLGEVRWISTASQPDICARLAHFTAKVYPQQICDEFRLTDSIETISSWQPEMNLRYGPTSYVQDVFLEGRPDAACGRQAQNGKCHFICRLPILTRRPAKSGPEERDKCV